MRKIKILAIAIVVVSIGVMGYIYISTPKPISKNEAVVEDNADLTFAVIGDVHGNTDNLQKTINDLYTINPVMDALVLNGDTVDQGIEKQYNSVKETISKNKELLPNTVIKNIGNHEFFDYDAGSNSPEQVQNFINKYLELSGEEKVYHDTWVNDYHFISLGSEDGHSDTADTTTAYISSNQLNWLREKLVENYQKGKPVFVFLHQPLDYGKREWVAVKESEQIREILSQYPEVILFSSHTHRDLVESSVILDQPFTIINTGAIDHTKIYESNGVRKEPNIKGLYIEVNGNKVIVKGRDIKENQWIFTKEISKE